MKNLISIIIPVYKSSVSLNQIVNEISELIKLYDYYIEVIFVNDSPCSSVTCDILQILNKNNSFVKIITLRKNQGQHLAIIVGLFYAKGDYVITMDDDLQHPVEEIPKLIEAMLNEPNLDAVFAIPEFKKRKHKLWRNLGSFLLFKLDNFFLKKPSGLVKSSFRIMKKSIADSIVNNYNAMPSLSSLIIRNTHNIKNITVAHFERKHGKSSYNFRKLISLTLNNYINYSSLPLKIIGSIGFITVFFTFCFVIYTLSRKMFFGLSYPGYTSIITLVGLLGGLNLLSVGIIGEYLIRIIKDLQKPNIQDLVSNNSNKLS